MSIQGFYNLNYFSNFNNANYYQNYAYEQTSMYPYQQQTASFGNYQYGYPQQQGNNTNSMLTTLMSSILPMLISLLGNNQNRQQPMFNQYAALPFANAGANQNSLLSGLASLFNGFGSAQQAYSPYQNNYSNINNGFGSLYNGFGLTQAYSPYQNNYNNINNGFSGYSNPFVANSCYPYQQQNNPMSQMYVIAGFGFSNRPLGCYQEGFDVNASATGDPHFGINGQQAFDFQGKNNGLYQMLNNSDVSLNAKFADYGSDGARIIKDQDLSFNNTGINLVSHADGTFEILQNGQKIADQTNYNTDQNAINALKNSNIDLSFANSNLTSTYANRTLTQQLAGGYINNTSDTLMNGDSGLLTQTIGALDTNHSGTTQMSVDVNKDGVVDEKDSLNYNLNNQYMVHTDTAGSSCATITPEIEALINKDMQSGIAQGSLVKGFAADHGYDARQWNEYVGAKAYEVNSDALLAA